MIPHLLRCQGFAVAYYSFTLDALDLEHPQLSLNSGIGRTDNPNDIREKMGLILRNAC
jgi:hypothetical protein